VGGQFEGWPLLLLTTIGAKSGERRTTPLLYALDGGHQVIFGGNGGRDRHPGWYYNILAEPKVTVEVGTEIFAAIATLAEGEDRQRIWTAAATPALRRFAETAHRKIPVVVLTRTTD
jgi:deazaflavin-dependent oxidoreductase (nitroreductase family)